MTTIVEELFHPNTVQAFQDLTHPDKSVQRPLSRGRAAGKLSLIYALFPPPGIHSNDVPARYTFVVEDGVTFELSLMVMLVDLSGDEHLIFGFVTHDQWLEMAEEPRTKKVEPQAHLVAVKYNPTTREGKVFMYKEFYAVVENIKADELLVMRERKDRRVRTWS